MARTSLQLLLNPLLTMATSEWECHILSHSPILPKYHSDPTVGRLTHHSPNVPDATERFNIKYAIKFTSIGRWLMNFPSV